MAPPLRPAPAALAAVLAIASLPPACRGADKAEDDAAAEGATEAEGDEGPRPGADTPEERRAVSSGAGDAPAETAEGLAAELAAPTPAEEGDGSDAEPTVPNLGGPHGRLIAGWEELRPGAKAADLQRVRPLARQSDVSGLVWSETLDTAWIAASYRFDRVGAHLAHVLWLGGPGARGEPVFRDLLKQGLHRWRRRPRITADDGARRSSWDTEGGEIRLSMLNDTGRIRLEWSPPPPALPDPFDAAVARIPGEAAAPAPSAPPPAAPPPAGTAPSPSATVLAPATSR